MNWVKKNIEKKIRGRVYVWLCSGHIGRHPLYVSLGIDGHLGIHPPFGICIPPGTLGTLGNRWPLGMHGPPESVEPLASTDLMASKNKEREGGCAFWASYWNCKATVWAYDLRIVGKCFFLGFAGWRERLNPSAPSLLV